MIVKCTSKCNKNLRNRKRRREKKDGIEGIVVNSQLVFKQYKPPVQWVRGFSRG